MNNTVDLQTRFLALAALEDPAIEAQGVLYFLEGHYLFRYRENKTVKTKFVTSADVAAAFTQQDLDTGWQPAGIVRQGQRARGQFFVYSAPAQRVEIRLAQNEAPVVVPIPRTVLLGIGGGYRLWALRSKYFSPDERAYLAPFPNINPGGSICWGQNTPPPAAVEKAREVWELFFETPFNQDLSAGKSVAHPEDVRLALRELAEKKARSFPIAGLVGERFGTIGQLIEQALS
jgi:hypothetical protein